MSHRCPRWWVIGVMWCDTPHRIFPAPSWTCRVKTSPDELVEYGWRNHAASRSESCAQIWGNNEWQAWFLQQHDHLQRVIFAAAAANGCGICWWCQLSTQSLDKSAETLEPAHRLILGFNFNLTIQVCNSSWSVARHSCFDLCNPSEWLSKQSCWLWPSCWFDSKSISRKQGVPNVRQI